jgi:hypothetical protein
MEMGTLHRSSTLASLVAKTCQLPRQPLTSHPSVKEQLDKGNAAHHFSRYPLLCHRSIDFDYREDSVVRSGNLITR